MALLTLEDISLSFGGFPVLDNINIQIHSGERICLLGRNGAGKTTMMKLINNELETDAGTVLKEKGIKTAFLPQDIPDNLNGTIYDIVANGLKSIDSESQPDHYEEQQNRQQIERVLSLLSLDPKLLFANLSAGMKRRLLLGRALVHDPDILLLDEPTNHLDINSIKWLEDFLARFHKTIFFVTHDRAFMQKIANRILELDRGRIFDWNCDYQTFLQRKEAWLDSEENENALFDRRLAQEEAWIRKGIRARRTRNEGRVRSLESMRDERSNRRERQGKARLEIQKTGASGKMIIEANEIAFAYDDAKLIHNFCIRILRGDKIGIIGPNGCGKSTLIRLLLKELSPQAGTVTIGTKLEKTYFDQLRDQLDETLTVRQNINDGNDMIDFNGKRKHVIGYLRDFLFSDERCDVKVETLSGGEKNRLLLARLFIKPINFLIMDEPTNDLDIETIELLEELLLEYKGTLLLVSHDRSFLNNVVTSTLVFEDSGSIKEYPGGYDDWLDQKQDDQNKTPNNKKSAKAKPERKKPDKLKLSYKEKKELEAIPTIIDEKELQKQDIFNLMADPAFYQQSGEKIAADKAELDTLEQELEALFTRWEELEALEQ